MVLLNDKYGFINRKDEIVIPMLYDRADQFHNGLAKVKLNGNLIKITKAGKSITSF